MKLVIMKLICLLVFLGGIYMLGLVFDISYVQDANDYVLQYWPKQSEGGLNLRMPGSIAGTVLFLIGLYGLLPKLPSRKSATITFKGAKGNITLQLKPIRKVLLKMMQRMPEVYSIDLNVHPDSDGHRACIEADVVLKNCAALGVRQCAKVVAECLDMTARDLLGLEDLSAIRVNVKGVHVDAAATGKQIREQLALRQAEASDAYASAHPPMAAITMNGENAQAADGKDAAGEETDETQETETVVKTVEEQEQAQPVEMAEASEPEPLPAEDTESDVPEAAVAEAIPEAPQVPDALKSDTLYGIDLPPLADDDADLPPAPQINEDGEITSDEVAENSILNPDDDDDEKTPDSVEIDVLHATTWSHEDLPEPAPEELGNDPSDVDVDTEEYPSV